VKAQHTPRYWLRELLRRALPAGTYRNLDRARRWRRYRRAGVVFVHVPKAAGSSVANVLYGGRLGHHAARELAREDAKGWVALEKFAILREPHARFLSAYAFAMSGGSPEGAIRWRPEYENPAYRDVNAFVRDYLAAGDILGKDVVFWPQSHFVCDESGRPMPGLRLFTTSQLDRVAEFLATLGFPAPPRMNRSRPAEGLNLGLAPATRKLLDEIYAADLAWFSRAEAGA
jgi:hypothetical protein